MSRSKVPARADARLEMATTVMLELCTGLMKRGAITTSARSIGGELLPHVEGFMGWVQSNFLDSITMSEHGTELRARCSKVNCEIDVLLKGGAVSRFVSFLRADGAATLPPTSATIVEACERAAEAAGQGDERERMVAKKPTIEIKPDILNTAFLKDNDLKNASAESSAYV